MIALGTTVTVACLLPILLRGKADYATSFFLISSLSVPAVILGIGGTALWRGTLRKWWEYREEWVISSVPSCSPRRGTVDCSSVCSLNPPQPSEKSTANPNGDQQVLDEKETGTGTGIDSVKALLEHIDTASRA
jgi:hypothetical protein